MYKPALSSARFNKWGLVKLLTIFSTIIISSIIILLLHGFAQSAYAKTPLEFFEDFLFGEAVVDENSNNEYADNED